MIMEVGKSPDPQGESAAWRPRKTDGLAPSQSRGMKTRRAHGIVPVLRPASLRPRKSHCFGLSLKVGELCESPLLSRAGSVVLLYLAPQLLDQAHAR